MGLSETRSLPHHWGKVRTANLLCRITLGLLLYLKRKNILGFITGLGRICQRERLRVQVCGCGVLLLHYSFMPIGDDGC